MYIIRLIILLLLPIATLANEADVKPKEELEKMADGNNLASDGLKMFLEDTTGAYGYPTRPGIHFRTPESQWLAYFMVEIHSKIWDRIKQEWIKIE